MASVSPILVAGVGNLLLSDDGVGVHAIHELQREPVPGVVFADIGTAMLHGLSFLEAAERVLLIDAAEGGRPPGTIYQFDITGPGESAGPCSVHALGWREALRLLPPGQRPPAITVLGVEPASFDYGMQLSPVVQAILPHLTARARQLIADWRVQPPVSSIPTISDSVQLCLC